MLKTEEEARKIRCVHQTDNCLASQCMAWRWRGEESPVERRTFYTMGEAPDGEGWTCALPDQGRESFVVKSQWERPIARRGYCGLAGKPD